MKKKTIYIPIEIKAREFTSQTLLASKIAERGGRVYLGGKSALFRAIKTKPNLGGTLLYKSGWPGGGFSDLKHHVSRIAVLDQEMSPSWPGLRPSHRFEDEEFDIIDRFYYVGEGFANSLLADRPELEESKVKVFGWPRVDLWTPRYSSFWEPESQKIRKRFGEFVLFSSDFGVLHAEDVPWRLARLEAGDLSTNFQGDPKKAELYLLGQVTEFRAVLAFLNSLDEDPDFPPVVVRPHPAEDHSRWVAALRGMRKTLLVYEGDASVWLQASTALLHRGCTTGLQAALVGKPAGFLEFAATASPWGRSVSRELSKPIQSMADAFDLLEEGLRVRPPAIERDLIANATGSSSEMISDDLLSLTTELEDRMPAFWQSPERQRKMFFRFRRKLIEKVQSQHRPSVQRLAVPRIVTQTNLKGGISAAEVRRVLHRLNALNATVKQVARNLVCIEAKDTLNRQIT